jgi:hypothetical protein
MYPDCYSGKLYGYLVDVKAIDAPSCFLPTMEGCRFDLGVSG